MTSADRSIRYMITCEFHELLKHSQDTLAANEFCWFTRIFTHKLGSFRNIVLTGIRNVAPIPEDAHDLTRGSANDIQQNQIIGLNLVPHQDDSCHGISALDFMMEDGILNLRTWAALVECILFRLVGSATLALGYVPSEMRD